MELQNLCHTSRCVISPALPTLPYHLISKCYWICRGGLARSTGRPVSYTHLSDWMFEELFSNTFIWGIKCVLCWHGCCGHLLFWFLGCKTVWLLNRSDRYRSSVCLMIKWIRELKGVITVMQSLLILNNETTQIRLSFSFNYSINQP